MCLWISESMNVINDYGPFMCLLRVKFLYYIASAYSAAHVIEPDRWRFTFKWYQSLVYDFWNPHAWFKDLMIYVFSHVFRIQSMFAWSVLFVIEFVNLIQIISWYAYQNCLKVFWWSWIKGSMKSCVFVWTWIFENP